MFGVGEQENGSSTLIDERYQQALMQQQMQEEQLLKSNIDYETRLKDHLYQFEDEVKG